MTTASDGLLKRARDPEDALTERKPEGAESAELRKTLVGFANSVPVGSTGVLCIGIRDDGSVAGVKNSDKLQKTIRRISQNCYPPITVQMFVCRLESREVVIVEVPPSETKPHFAGPAYVRVGSETIVASRQLYEDLIASRHEKARVILGQKGKVVKVLALGRPLGQFGGSLDKSYISRHECRIENCTPHSLTMFDIKKQSTSSVPLEDVSIASQEEGSVTLTVGSI